MILLKIISFVLNLVRENKSKNLIKHDSINLKNFIFQDKVKQNDLALKYVKEHTNEICLEAVKQNGLIIPHVNKQTKEICLEAVKQYGRALMFIKNRTNEICLEAVKNNSLTYVNKKYIKYIYKYLKSINFKDLFNKYKFIIDKDLVI